MVLPIAGIPQAQPPSQSGGNAIQALSQGLQTGYMIKDRREAKARRDKVRKIMGDRTLSVENRIDALLATGDIEAAMAFGNLNTMVRGMAVNEYRAGLEGKQSERADEKLPHEIANLQAQTGQIDATTEGIDLSNIDKGMDIGMRQLDIVSGRELRSREAAVSAQENEVSLSNILIGREELFDQAGLPLREEQARIAGIEKGNLLTGAQTNRINELLEFDKGLMSANTAATNATADATRKATARAEKLAPLERDNLNAQTSSLRQTIRESKSRISIGAADRRDRAAEAARLEEIFDFEVRAADLTNKLSATALLTQQLENDFRAATLQSRKDAVAVELGTAREHWKLLQEQLDEFKNEMERADERHDKLMLQADADLRLTGEQSKKLSNENRRLVRMLPGEVRLQKLAEEASAASTAAIEGAESRAVALEDIVRLGMVRQNTLLFETINELKSQVTIDEGDRSDRAAAAARAEEIFGYEKEAAGLINQMTEAQVLAQQLENEVAEATTEERKAGIAVQLATARQDLKLITKQIDEFQAEMDRNVLRHEKDMARADADKGLTEATTAGVKADTKLKERENTLLVALDRAGVRFREHKAQADILANEAKAGTENLRQSKETYKNFTTEMEKLTLAGERLDQQIKGVTSTREGKLIADELATNRLSRMAIRREMNRLDALHPGELEIQGLQRDALQQGVDLTTILDENELRVRAYTAEVDAIEASTAETVERTAQAEDTYDNFTIRMQELEVTAADLANEHAVAANEREKQLVSDKLVSNYLERQAIRGEMTRLEELHPGVLAQQTAETAHTTARTEGTKAETGLTTARTEEITKLLPHQENLLKGKIKENEQATRAITLANDQLEAVMPLNILGAVEDLMLAKERVVAAKSATEQGWGQYLSQMENEALHRGEVAQDMAFKEAANNRVEELHEFDVSMATANAKIAEEAAVLASLDRRIKEATEEDAIAELKARKEESIVRLASARQQLDAAISEEDRRRMMFPDQLAALRADTELTVAQTANVEADTTRGETLLPGELEQQGADLEQTGAQTDAIEAGTAHTESDKLRVDLQNDLQTVINLVETANMVGESNSDFAKQLMLYPEEQRPTHFESYISKYDDPQLAQIAETAVTPWFDIESGAADLSDANLEKIVDLQEVLELSGDLISGEFEAANTKMLRALDEYKQRPNLSMELRVKGVLAASGFPEDAGVILDPTTGDPIDMFHPMARSIQESLEHADSLQGGGGQQGGGGEQSYEGVLGSVMGDPGQQGGQGQFQDAATGTGGGNRDFFSSQANLSDTSVPLPLRNNNPMAVRFSEDNDWQGQEGQNGGFAVFDSGEKGIRAGAKVLLSYQRRLGATSVDRIISRWAPSSENNTNAYIAKVKGDLSRAGYSQADMNRLDMRNEHLLMTLTKSIIGHENGQQPFSDVQILAAVKSAMES